MVSASIESPLAAVAPPSPKPLAALPQAVQALLRPETYDHPADDLRLHETHISWVVLAGPYAYKLKKPVDLGFLDFTTVQQRRADCVAEVRLNRRLCPELYRGVEWLVEREGAYRVGGPGRRVEPLVWMRRLPAAGMLDTRLAAGAVEPGLMRRIANRLARFHARARTGPGVDEHGGVATIRGNWDENFAQTRAFVGRTMTAETDAAVQDHVVRFLARERTLLDRRVATGRIRDGHGDLHAGSVCVEGRHVHLFDCLEFADRFRCADVAAEVAFLAMDLDHHGRAELGVALVDAYLRASGDLELPRLVDFYKCYRAYVRGKVLGFRLDDPTLSPAERAAIAGEARAYFELARSYTGDRTPRLIVTMGLPATGKTTLAHALAGQRGLVHLSSDAVRKGLVGLRPGQTRRDEFGHGLYDPAMTRRTYRALLRRAERWLRRGRSVVLDGTYGDRRRRASVRRLAARLGVPLTVLVCQADEATLRARLAARTPVRGIASDARLDLWPALRAAYTPPLELPEAVAIDTTRSLPDAVAAALAAVAGGQLVDLGAVPGSGYSPTSNRPAARPVVTQERPMSPTVLAPRRVRELTLALKAEAVRLRRSLDALDRAGRELAASQADEGDFNAELGDIATDLAEEELDLSLTTIGHARRAAVEAALLRLAEGCYGRCERCGDAIDGERLGALPWTSYCVRCAAAPGPHPPATVPARFAERFD